MNYYGANLGETSFLKRLRDGSLTLLRPRGQVLTLVEEQHSGEKYKGGFSHSLTFLRSNYSIQGDFAAGVTSCCEPEPSTLEKWENVFQCPVTYVNHHTAHAFEAVFSTECGDNALVIVADAGGNVLEKFDELRGNNWWEYSREQLTVFLWSKNRLQLVRRYFAEPFAIGPGEFWRYVTNYCGFASSMQASKLMELAAWFDGEKLKAVPFFESESSIVQKNTPLNKSTLDGALGEIKRPKGVRERAAVSAWAQNSMFLLFNKIILDVQKEYECETVCLSGGVALNCRMVQQLNEALPKIRVLVGFAPGDRGQSIGASLAVAHKHGILNRISKVTPFIGMTRKASSRAIRDLLSQTSHTTIVDELPMTLIYDAVDNGFLLATWGDRSEIGPRALGNSSLVMNAFYPGAKDRLNEVKGRPSDTPVAPVFLEDDLVERAGRTSYNYRRMAETVALDEFSDDDGNDLRHIDGTVRPQTVSSKENGFLFKLFCEAKNRREQVNPVFFNTSFNDSGRPMVGTLEQAVDSFERMNIDLIYLGKKLVVRRKSARLESLIDKNQHRGNFFENIEELRNSPLGTSFGNIEERNRFQLFDNYIEWLKAGRKVTTIRYIPNGISVPAKLRLPLVETKSFKQTSVHVSNDYVRVLGFTIKRFSELDRVDAERDGFDKTSHLKRILESIYPTIQPSDFVTVNFIEMYEN